MLPTIWNLRNLRNLRMLPTIWNLRNLRNLRIPLICEIQIGEGESVPIHHVANLYRNRR
jgi:hypothetical protein